MDPDKQIIITADGRVLYGEVDISASTAGLKNTDGEKINVDNDNDFYESDSCRHKTL